MSTSQQAKLHEIVYWIQNIYLELEIIDLSPRRSFNHFECNANCQKIFILCRDSSRCHFIRQWFVKYILLIQIKARFFLTVNDLFIMSVMSEILWLEH